MMRSMLGVMAVLALGPACTRNVEDRQVYEACFVDAECETTSTNGCFRILGETASLGICSVFCTDDCQGGTCSDAYEMTDGGPTGPICIQSCTADSDCPTGGFACRSGSCLPP